eukprot:scaffold6090_cov326-Prasinococcus_capsulatus_cf.AAC.3
MGSALPHPGHGPGPVSRNLRYTDFPLLLPVTQAAYKPSLVRRQCLRLALYLRRSKNPTPSTLLRQQGLHTKRLDASQMPEAKPLPKTAYPPDCVASSQTDPLRDRSVLLLLLGQNALNLESLLGRLRSADTTPSSACRRSSVR